MVLPEHCGCSRSSPTARVRAGVYGPTHLLRHVRFCATPYSAPTVLTYALLPGKPPAQQYRRGAASAISYGLSGTNLGSIGTELVHAATSEKVGCCGTTLEYAATNPEVRGEAAEAAAETRARIEGGTAYELPTTTPLSPYNSLPTIPLR
eukprot:86610-Rhodomonas_salina.2